MNNLRQTVLILLLTICGINFTNAQGKIVEKSAKQAPKWIGAVGKDFIAVSATDASIDVAQKKCMTDILQHIVNSVAVNIVSTENSSSQQVEENKIVKLVESYASYVKTQGASLAFITNISISNALGVYWEKYYVKSEKRYYYVYHVSYPFSESERNALIAEFKDIDDSYNNKFRELQQDLELFTEVEFIDRAILDLEPLIAYFFDATRLQMAKSLQVKYRKEYENISVVPQGAMLGEFNYSLRLNGRTVTTSRQPILRSNCASNITVKQTGSDYKIEYEYGDCLDNEDNTIELTYQFGGRPLRYKFPFNVKENKIMVAPQGIIDIESISKADTDGDNALVTIPLRSKYDSEFVVEELTLSVPGIKNTIRTGNINKRFQGKGTHLLTIRCTITRDDTNSKSILTQGTMRIRSIKNGQTQNITIQLPFKIK